jgi:hypothetical protein
MSISNKSKSPERPSPLSQSQYVASESGSSSRVQTPIVEPETRLETVVTANPKPYKLSDFTLVQTIGTFYSLF